MVIYSIRSYSFPNMYKKKLFFMVVFISGAIETIQFISATGICELDDVISNGFGGVIGYITSKTIMEIKDMFLLGKKMKVAKV